LRCAASWPEPGVRFALVAALFLSACGAPSPAEFPIGFYGVGSRADAEKLSEAGFNALQPYADNVRELSALTTAADRLGMMALVSPHGIIGSTFTPRQFPGAVWYLLDEPDVNGVDLPGMEAIETQTLAWAPGAKTAFVVGDGRKAKNYPGIADAIMVDWYPVPHLPLESAGDHVRLTAEAAGGRKLWAVLQAMDWRDFPQRDPKKKRIGRFPDINEIRFMSYDAVLNGAQGIWYYTFSTSSARTLAQTPEHLYAVTSVAGEIHAMAPVFARGRSIPLPFEPPTKGWMARSWTYRGRDYLVLANRTRDRQWKVPAEALKPMWRPLFEARRDPRELLKMHLDAYYLRPYQVLVLESRLRPSRLLGR